MFGFHEFLQGLRLTWLPGCRTILAPAALVANRDMTTTMTGGRLQLTAAAEPDRPPLLPTKELVQNPNRGARFVGNTPLAVNIRTHTIREAIRVSGVDPPMVMHEERANDSLLSWHVKGTCSSACARKQDYVANNNAEAEALHTWHQATFVWGRGRLQLTAAAEPVTAPRRQLLEASHK